MKKYLQIFSFAIVTSLVLMFCAGYAMAQSPKPRVSASSVSGNKNDIVEVVIRIDDCPMICGFDFRLHVDSSKLEYQGYSMGEASKGLFAVSNFKDDAFIYVGVVPKAVNATGDIVTLKLKVLSDEKETIPLTFMSMMLLDVNNQEYEYTAVNGTVSINGGTGSVNTTTIASDTSPKKVDSSSIKTSTEKPHEEGTTTAKSDNEPHTGTNSGDGEKLDPDIGENPDVFKITSNFSVGGTVEPMVKFVDQGDSVELAFIPDDGYYLASLTINDELIEASDNRYTIENIRENYEIYASFELISGSLEESEDDAPIIDDESKLSAGKKALIIILVVLTLAAGVVITVINAKKSDAKSQNLELDSDNSNNEPQSPELDSKNDENQEKME